MNSKIIITLFSLFAEFERDMISLRTKEALQTKKAQGIKLGKPKGLLLPELLVLQDISNALNKVAYKE